LKCTGIFENPGICIRSIFSFEIYLTKLIPVNGWAVSSPDLIEKDGEISVEGQDLVGWVTIFFCYG